MGGASRLDERLGLARSERLESLEPLDWLGAQRLALERLGA
jgi:hypothetical protein